jgi:hypothetical protein
MADMHEGELELELENEFGEGEEESGMEGEGWLGAIGNIASSLLGEGEGEEELEEEFEGEGEGEFEEELEGELEEESGEGEGWLGAIGNIASSLLGEGEGEFEGESEFEAEGEEEVEGEQEMIRDIAAHELTHNEAVAEMMADAAASATHEGEAEALVGAATVTVISPRDRRALRRILPHLVRGTAILTRILRRRRRTRRAVRALPTIVRRAVKDLKRQAAKGIPITRKRAVGATVKQARRVLKSPKACATAITRNLKVSRAYKRPSRRIRGRRIQRRRRAMR